MRFRISAAAGSSETLSSDDLEWFLSTVLNAADEITVDGAYVSALFSAALAPELANGDAASPTARNVVDFLTTAIACHPSLDVKVGGREDDVAAAVRTNAC